MRVIFMGTPDFAVPTLDALVEAGHDVIAVVAQPDRPKGRGQKMVHHVARVVMHDGKNKPYSINARFVCCELGSVVHGVVPVGFLH